MYYIIMPRTKSNSSIKTRTSLPTGRNYSAPAPAPAPAPPSLPSSSSGPSFFSTMTQGLALGMGSSLGHRAVDTMFGAPVPTVSTPTSTSVANTPYACNNNLGEYIKCIHEQTTVQGLQTDSNICNKLYDDYLRCISTAESSDHYAFAN